jgi:Asp/Glu/hydantoin racemase
MNITAHIDVSTPTGRRIIKELETHKRVVKIENPMPVGADGLPEETFSVEDIFAELDQKLKKHYGITD